eukprot:2388641-Amphidinium_carterae.1
MTILNRASRTSVAMSATYVKAGCSKGKLSRILKAVRNASLATKRAFTDSGVFPLLTNLTLVPLPGGAMDQRYMSNELLRCSHVVLHPIDTCSYP